MQLTTKNIIKILPLDQKMKEDMLANFDSYPSERKFLVEQIVWEAYDDFFMLRLEENLMLGRLEAQERKKELGPDFYQRMRKKTEEEIMSQSVAAAEKLDLDVAREKLATVLSDQSHSSE